MVDDDTANSVLPLEGTRVLLTTEHSFEGQIVAFVLLKVIMITVLEGLFETKIGLDT